MSDEPPHDWPRSVIDEAVKTLVRDMQFKNATQREQRIKSLDDPLLSVAVNQLWHATDPIFISRAARSTARDHILADPSYKSMGQEWALPEEEKIGDIMNYITKDTGKETREKVLTALMSDYLRKWEKLEMKRYSEELESKKDEETEKMAAEIIKEDVESKAKGKEKVNKKASADCPPSGFKVARIDATTTMLLEELWSKDATQREQHIRSLKDRTVKQAVEKLWWATDPVFISNHARSVVHQLVEADNNYSRLKRDWSPPSENQFENLVKYFDGLERGTRDDILRALVKDYVGQLTGTDTEEEFDEARLQITREECESMKKDGENKSRASQNQYNLGNDGKKDKDGNKKDDVNKDKDN